MTVVDQWRDRARNLRAEYWRCQHCDAFFAVRRARCVHCGASGKPVRARLPAKLRASGTSHAHTPIEMLDQIEARRPVMLMELPQGRWLPIRLADADREVATALVGETLTSFCAARATMADSRRSHTDTRWPPARRRARGC